MCCYSTILSQDYRKLSDKNELKGGVSHLFYQHYKEYELIRERFESK